MQNVLPKPFGPNAASSLGVDQVELARNPPTRYAHNPFRLRISLKRFEWKVELFETQTADAETSRTYSETQSVQSGPKVLSRSNIQILIDQFAILLKLRRSVLKLNQILKGI